MRNWGEKSSVWVVVRELVLQGSLGRPSSAYSSRSPLLAWLSPPGGSPSPSFKREEMFFSFCLSRSLTFLHEAAFVVQSAVNARSVLLLVEALSCCCCYFFFFCCTFFFTVIFFISFFIVFFCAYRLYMFWALGMQSQFAGFFSGLSPRHPAERSRPRFFAKAILALLWGCEYPLTPLKLHCRQCGRSRPRIA